MKNSAAMRGLLLLLFAAASRAQDPSPPVVSLHLTAHQFREGELMRAEITAPERWQFGGLRLDPPAKCGTIDALCFSSVALWFDQSDPMLRLGDRSGQVAAYLNDYLPALRPGHYRTAVVVRKLVLLNRGPMSATYGYPTPPVTRDVELGRV